MWRESTPFRQIDRNLKAGGGGTIDQMTKRTPSTMARIRKHCHSPGSPGRAIRELHMTASAHRVPASFDPRPSHRLSALALCALPLWSMSRLLSPSQQTSRSKRIPSLARRSTHRHGQLTACVTVSQRILPFLSRNAGHSKQGEGVRLTSRRGLPQSRSELGASRRRVLISRSHQSSGWPLCAGRQR